MNIDIMSMQKFVLTAYGLTAGGDHAADIFIGCVPNHKLHEIIVNEKLSVLNRDA